MKKPSLPVQIILGLVLGIALGIVELVYGLERFYHRLDRPFWDHIYQPIETHCHSFGTVFNHRGYWES